MILIPVEFLSDKQAARGRYQADPNVEQLTRYFYLNPADVWFLARRRWAANNWAAPSNWARCANCCAEVWWKD